MTDTIATPYAPEDHVGEWGWMWADGDNPGWLLCATFEDNDGWLRISIWDTESSRPDELDLSGESWRGTPYIPLSNPGCSSTDGLLVTLHLPGGLMALSMAPGDDAESVRERVMAAMGLRGEATD